MSFVSASLRINLLDLRIIAFLCVGDGMMEHQHSKLSTNHVTSLVGYINVYRYIGTSWLSTNQVCVLYLWSSVSQGSSHSSLFSSGVNPAGIHGRFYGVYKHTISVKLMPSFPSFLFRELRKNHGETLPFSHQTMASSKTHETALNENTRGG